MNFILDKFKNLTFLWCDAIRVEETRKKEKSHVKSVLKEETLPFTGIKTEKSDASYTFKSHGEIKERSSPLRMQNTVKFNLF